MFRRRMLRSFLSVLLITLLVSGASSAAGQEDESSCPVLTTAELESIDERAREIVQSMSPAERVGQTIMVSWSYNQLTPSLERLIDDYHVGSVYISGRNFGNSSIPTAAQQVAGLANDLQTFTWDAAEENGQDAFIPLFIAADHEGDGARYTRIRTGMTAIPSPLAIGATWDAKQAEEIGEIVGKELAAIGVNLLLGPVVDVLDEPDRGEDGNLDVRVFGGDPHWVGEMGRAYVRGIHCGSSGHVLTTAKHFPGHGDSNRATDKAVANKKASFDDLMKSDLIPFLRVTEGEVGIDPGVTDAIMSSHIAITETTNVPISIYFDTAAGQGGIDQIVERATELRHWYENGIMIVDSLGVGAIRNQYLLSQDSHKDVALNAVLSGNDMLILHDVLTSDQRANSVEELDTLVHQNVVDVIDELVSRYENDTRVRNQVDHAVLKIVEAKLRLYPDLLLEEVTVDESDVARLSGQDESADKVERVAENSVTLLKPASPRLLPPPPGSEDKILFVVQDFEVPNCPACGAEWLETVDDVFLEFLVQERGFNRDNLTMMRFYREVEDPLEGRLIGMSEYLYSQAWVGTDEVSEEARQDVYRKLRDSDWIVFLFVAGDCGPDAFRVEQRGRCVRGHPESDTLKKFLGYLYHGTNRATITGNVVALSFGAPPWILDETDVARLDAYYGGFNQLEPFQRQTLLALLQESPPSGASPISVEGSDYFLAETLLPSQQHSGTAEVIEVGEDGSHDWQVGNEIRVQLSGIKDYNGNLLLAHPDVVWRGLNRDTGESLTPIDADTSLHYGVAQASFLLNAPGELDISAAVGDVEAKPAVVRVAPVALDQGPDESDEDPAPAGDEVSAPETQSEKVAEVSTDILDEPAQSTLPEAEPTSPSQPPTLAPTATPTPTSWLAGVVAEVTENPITVLIGCFTILISAVGVAITWLEYRRKQESNEPGSSAPQTDETPSARDRALAENVSAPQKVRYYEILDQSYSMEELQDLAFRMGIDYENLSQGGQAAVARELVEYCDRHGRLPELAVNLRRQRPHLFNGDDPPAI